jgi:DNA polymerase III sliding clamp (beta) subunit (PCNA family)
VKFTTNAANFASALTSVMRSINTRLSIIGGRGVLIETTGDRITLTGTDLDTVTRVSLAADAKERGRMLVGADKLVSAFLRPSASDAQFTAKGKGEVLLNIGRSRFNLRQMDPDDFPRLPDVPDAAVWTFPGAHLHLVANQVSFAAAEPGDNKPALLGTAIRFRDKYAQALAGTNRFVAELQLPYGDVAPAPGLKDLVLLPTSLERMKALFDEGDQVQVSVSENWAGFSVDDGGVQFLTKTQAEPFPDMDRILESIHAGLCSWAEADRVVLLDEVRRMDTVASEEDIHPLRIHASGSRLDFWSATSYGTAEGYVDADQDGPEYRAVVNAQYLGTLLGKVPGDRVRIDFPQDGSLAHFVLTPASVPEGSPRYTLYCGVISPGAPQAAATLAGPEGRV